MLSQESKKMRLSEVAFDRVPEGFYSFLKCLVSGGEEEARNTLCPFILNPVLYIIH